MHTGFGICLRFISHSVFWYQAETLYTYYAYLSMEMSVEQRRILFESNEKGGPNARSSSHLILSGESAT